MKAASASHRRWHWPRGHLHFGAPRREGIYLVLQWERRPGHKTLLHATKLDRWLAPSPHWTGAACSGARCSRLRGSEVRGTDTSSRQPWGTATPAPLRLLALPPAQRRCPPPPGARSHPVRAPPADVIMTLAPNYNSTNNRGRFDYQRMAVALNTAGLAEYLRGCDPRYASTEDKLQVGAGRAVLLRSQHRHVR